MKKGKFGIIATTGLLVPFVVMSSCSSTSTNDSKDFNITAISKPDVKREDIMDDKYKNLATLQKLFNGINAENQNFFNVSLETEVSQGKIIYKIVLTCEDGYTINGKPSFSSESFTIIDISLDIIAKNDPKVNQADIEGENFKTIETLEKVFNISNADLEFIDLDNTTIDIDEKTITLVTKPGYVFANGSNTLVSNPFIVTLAITAETTKQTLKVEEIEGENFKTIETLEKVFNISAADLEFIDLDSTTIDTSKRTITLVAKPGYGFEDGTNNLVSLDFTVDLAITKIENLTEDMYKNDIQDGNFRISRTLEKLFNGINENTISFITVSINPGVINPDPSTKYTITIKANEGCIINGVATPVSSVPFVVTTNLNITKKIIQDPIFRSDLINENWKSMKTLQKLFDGVTESNYILLTYFNLGGADPEIADMFALVISPGIDSEYKINGDTNLSTMVGVVIEDLKTESPILPESKLVVSILENRFSIK